jgi:uncharacterized protein YgiM (DUF1202 family)
MTTPQTTDIAVLKTKVENIDKVLTRVETKIDAQSELYVTRTEFNEFKSKWLLSHTLSAVMGSVLTGLIVYFLTRR